MGNLISTYDQKETTMEQFPLLKKINIIIDEMITTGNLFSNKHYNINENTCYKYQMVLEKEIEKSFKVDLSNMDQKIFLIDPDYKTTINGKQYSKKQLCQQVYNYYQKILNIILSIKLIFDLEHESEQSLLSIVLNNLVFTKDALGIQYCSIKQGTTALDMKQLSGIEHITKNLYTKEEAKQLISHVKNMVQNESFSKVKGIIGKETLLGDKDLQKIYGGLYSEKLPNIKEQELEFTEEDMEEFLEPSKAGVFGNVDTTVNWIKNNLIVSQELCDMKNRKVALVSQNHMQFKIHLNKLIDNAKNNISQLLNILSKMVKYDLKTNKFKLVFVEVSELQKYERLSKYYIMMFYLQLMGDYKRLLNIALKFQS